MPGMQDEAPRTVLVVDDELTVRQLVGRVLQADGWRVLEAEHGRDALAVLESHAPAIALVLSDVLMPEMNGPELAREASRRWPAMPFLFMSGFAGDDMLEHGQLAPETPLLRKPFMPATLTTAIRALLVA
jgi:two-component system, cell cycle sensor histidine kinase and response regulator CckA